jgi:hypothetical protein
MPEVCALQAMDSAAVRGTRYLIGEAFATKDSPKAASRHDDRRAPPRREDCRAPPRAPPSSPSQPDWPVEFREYAERHGDWDIGEWNSDFHIALAAPQHLRLRPGFARVAKDSVACPSSWHAPVSLPMAARSPPAPLTMHVGPEADDAEDLCLLGGEPRCLARHASPYQRRKQQQKHPTRINLQVHCMFTVILAEVLSDELTIMRFEIWTRATCFNCGPNNNKWFVLRYEYDRHSLNFTEINPFPEEMWLAN